tara:strand:+ start:460 stop:1872 length:1413 start_codon:yes stop_codon:yes gene_type:complete
MADNEYINSGYITKMGDNSTHNGSAGQPVDGVDFPHSGLIKALNTMATTGYAALTAAVGTGSKNFNMQMNDGTAVTVITVRTGKVVRNGTLQAATAEATITEVTSGTETDVQFQEQTTDSAGQNRYSLIVVNSSNVVKIRHAAGVDKVADLTAGDIPIAVLRISKGEAKATRHIQYLTSPETDGIGLDIDGYSALGGTGLHQTQDHFVFSDNGTEKKISFTNLEDAIFGNVSGDIAIAAGGAATIQANSVALGTDTVGNYMTDVSAGTGIDVTHTPAEGSTATVAVDVSDFMANGANNYVVTALTADTMNAEANMQFTGSALSVTGSIAATTTIAADQTVTGTIGVVSGGNFSAGYEVLDAAAGLPAPTLSKKVIYSFNLVPAGNTFALPNAVANQIHYIKNIDPTNPITITPAGGEHIDLGQHAGGTGTVACVTAANVITLTPQQSVTIQGANDSTAPITPGWMVIAHA